MQKKKNRIYRYPLSEEMKDLGTSGMKDQMPPDERVCVGESVQANPFLKVSKVKGGKHRFAAKNDRKKK